MRVKLSAGVLLAFLSLPSCALAARWNLIVADHGVEGTGHAALIQVDPRTGAQTAITHGGHGNVLVDPTGIAIGRDGSLYVADSSAFGGAGGVIKVNPVTGTQTVIARGHGLLYDPDGIAERPDGTLLVVDFRGPGGSGGLGLSGGVLTLNPATGAQIAVSRSDGTGNLFVNPAAVAYESPSSILVTDFSAFGGGGGVIRVDPTTGQQTAISPTATSGPTLFTTGARGLALSGRGGVFVVNQASPGEVVGIDESTGDQSLIAHDGLLRNLGGPALEPTGNLVVPTGAGNRGALVRVDPVDGGQTRIAHGDLLHEPLAVVLAVPRPVIRSFSLSGGRVGSGRAARFSYRLSEAANVQISLRRGGRRVATLTQSGRAGRNRLRFTGRVSGKPLATGGYRAVIRATLPFAPASARHTVTFTIVR